MVRKNDSEIKQAVLEEFKWNTRIKETEIGVEVENGVVTLTGTVSDYAKKMAAQEAAHFVVGVLDVANNIVVKAPGSPGRTDTEIAQAVRHAIEWDVRVPHERIRSTVSDGIVNLEGNVDFLREREDAERAVRYLDGVCGVRNYLRISPSTMGADEVRAMIEKVLERRASHEIEREAKRIQVSVTEGNVTLRGKIGSFAEKRAILGALSHAPGVHTVTDHLRIETENLTGKSANK